jgi:hypothetical protein
MTSQPSETELNNEEPIDSDEAVLEQLARKREQPAEEGADAEDEEEEANSTEESEETEEAAEEVEDDPEFDLGDVKAKKSEVLAWKQGAMKDADYRQKTAEVAEAKRAAQALQERVETERTHYANHLDALIGQLQTQLVGDQRALAQLAENDPAEWVRQNAQYQDRFQRFQQALGERQVIEQRAKDEKDRKHGEWVQSNSEILHEKLPEWRDPAVKAKELGDMEAFLRQQGVGDKDMESFMNHRIYLIARQAWQAQKREAARATAKDKQVQKQPPKPLKAGAAQSETQATDAYKDAQKRARSGKEEDLMALLAAKRRNA